MIFSFVSVALLANMRPPSYEVNIPHGREWIYEYAAGVFATMAIVASGWWCLRRRTLRPASRRALLWLVAGCAAVAYSVGWAWSHRDAGLVPSDLPGSIAAWMPWVWGAGCAAVLALGWSHVCRVGGLPTRVMNGVDSTPNPGGGTFVLISRALVMAVVTVVVADVCIASGLREAYVILLPVILLPGLLLGDELVAIGVSVVVWWLVWGFIFWCLPRQRMDGAETDRSEGQVS